MLPGTPKLGDSTIIQYHKLLLSINNIIQIKYLIIRSFTVMENNIGSTDCEIF